MPGRKMARLIGSLRHSHPASWFRPGRFVRSASGGPAYRLSAPLGRRFAFGFRPQLSPARMLRMGVFEGKYICDAAREFPREWYVEALRRGKLSPDAADSACNEFGVKSRMSLGDWRRRGWIERHDPRGWFQWYCRYYIGRRLPDVDAVQIARWRSFARHRAQIIASYQRMRRPLSRSEKRDHRMRQRQALLQWAYDPYC